jgi:flagellar motor switch/type III secretory pathway protein FliN
MSDSPLPRAEIDLTVELGKKRTDEEELSNIGAHHTLKLNKRTGDPMDIFARNKLIARGSLVIGESFQVRITEIYSPTDEQRDERAFAGQTHKQLRVVLGTARYSVSEILTFHPGTVVALGRGPNEPLEIMVENRLVGRGSLVILPDTYAIIVSDWYH